MKKTGGLKDMGKLPQMGKLPKLTGKSLPKKGK